MFRLFLSQDLQSFDLAAALRDISAERREKALKFRFEQGQRECVLAYLLLKRALREMYGIEGNPALVEQEGGKPMLKDHPHIYFNISHCKEAVACVVGDEPLGVDVERIRNYSPDLVRYTMSGAEQEVINSSQQPEREFIRLWTKKEAVLKLTGQGIRDDLKTVLPAEGVVFEITDEEHFVCTVARYANLI